MPDNLNKSDIILEVKDLKMRFGKLEVLRGVNTTVRRGEVIVVIGASGAGKSTFLRCLNRLETPTDGDILFEGESVVHAGRNLNTLRERMGMVFQQFNLFNNLNVLDNITLAPTIVKKADKAKSEEEARALLRRVGLEDKAAAYPAQLSGGQRQRIAIVRALAMHPDDKLIYEPTTAQDPDLGARRHAPARRRRHDHGRRHPRDGLCPQGRQPHPLHGGRRHRRGRVAGADL